MKKTIKELNEKVWYRFAKGSYFLIWALTIIIPLLNDYFIWNLRSSEFLYDRFFSYLLWTTILFLVVRVCFYYGLTGSLFPNRKKK